MQTYRKLLAVAALFLLALGCDDAAPAGEIDGSEAPADMGGNIVPADAARQQCELAGLGDECGGGDECCSTYCAAVDCRRVCTRTCSADADCPADWVCLQVTNAGVDTTFICVPPRPPADVCPEDPDSCGGEGFACPDYPNGERLCTNGRCHLGDCDEGFEDIDGNAENGCECAPQPEVCNGGDDDCDGVVDNVDGFGEACTVGVGTCQAMGATECVDGALACSAVPGDAGEEVCNSEDDDCDGLVDEEFDLQDDPSHCGACGNACDVPNTVGACVEGQCDYRCEDDWADCNNSIEPDGCETAGECGPDLCNGQDDDADGEVDEDFVPAPCGVGRCASESRCEAGQVVACVAAEGAAEICNEVDDDCDGDVDETFNLQFDPSNCGACGNVCEVPNTVPACVAGECDYRCEDDWSDCNDSLEPDGCETAGECGPDGCNGQDDDADGEVDEDFVPVACGVGPCTSASRCGDGQEVACEPAAPAPDDSACDGADNDCDGEVDEDFVPQECGVGVCVAASSCEAGVVVACVPRDPQRGDDASCDGLDNDCSGEVDEDYEPRDCGVGACAASSSCVDGQMVACVAAEAADEETCNEVDDDCDGATDEGLGVGDACETGIGACRIAGLLVCGDDGGTVCDAEPVEGRDDDATCDGVDDDCDGSEDEDHEVERCGVGLCFSESSCARGVETPCEAGDPDVEACNGVDDDCNGVIDDVEDADVGAVLVADSGSYPQIATDDTGGFLVAWNDGGIQFGGPLMGQRFAGNGDAVGEPVEYGFSSRSSALVSAGAGFGLLALK